MTNHNWFLNIKNHFLISRLLKQTLPKFNFARDMYTTVVLYIWTHSKSVLVVLNGIGKFHKSYIPPDTLSLELLSFNERLKSSGCGTKYYCPLAISINLQNIGFFTLIQTKIFSSMRPHLLSIIPNGLSERSFSWWLVIWLVFAYVF